MNSQEADLAFKQIKLLKNNSVYRFSDLFYKYGIRWEKDRREILENPLYGDTILYHYLARMKSENDVETLKHIIKDIVNRKGFAIPDADELVLHLRLGDIMDDYDFDMSKRHFNDCATIYSNLGSYLSNLKVERVTIVTALHFGANVLNNQFFFSDRAYERSREIFFIVYSQLKNYCDRVSVLSNDDFDQDLSYMSGSKLFIGSLSNVSKIIMQCLDNDAVAISLSKHYNNPSAN